MAKNIDFFDGAQSSTTPTIGNVDTTNLACYANDAAYEAANLGAPTEGNIYCNTTDNTIRYYNGTVWTELSDTATAQIFSNKTIDGTSATGTNSVLIDADDASYDNTISGLTATNVKTAIDEVDAKADANTTAVGTAQGSADANTTDIVDLRTTTGTGDGDTDMGAYTGAILTDNVAQTTLNQELSDAIEVIGSPLVLQGNWNATTNTPTLVSSTGTEGDFYIVSVAGTTSLDGEADWGLGDWCVFGGGVWFKQDNSQTVDSVNGQTGAVSIAINDISDVNTGGVGARYRLQRNSINSLWIDINPYSNQTDATSGSNVTLSSIVEEHTKRLTSGTLVSVDMIPASFQGDVFVLLNDTGNPIVLNNETGATAADQLLTGSGGPITLKDGASLGLLYDANVSVTKWRIIGGVGSGDGATSGIITGDESTADTTVGDWVAYADAAGTTPVDGTGGSPNITLTRTTVANEILQGSGSFKLSKGSFDRQGEGGSLDIPAPAYIRGQASQISFSYSATEVAGGLVGDEFLTTDSTLAFSTGFIGQTFLTTSAYTPNKVGMILHKNSLTPTGDFKLHLYATSAGVPTGAAIASTALLDASALPSTASGIQQFDLLVPTALADATTYAIAIEDDSLVGEINADRTGASVYPSGGRVTSADGISWGGPFTGDYAFSILEDTSVGFNYGSASDPVGDPSDISIFLYDVTNSKILNVSQPGIFGGGLYRANVQIPSDCEDVRVIVHIASTSALAYDFIFDRVELDVAPSQFLTRANSSDIKFLTADNTSATTLSDLTFSNLSIGSWYRVSLQAYLRSGSNLTTVTTLNTVHDSATIMTNNHQSSGTAVGGAHGIIKGNSRVFKATATSLTFTSSHSGGGSRIHGNSTASETWAQLETLNDHEDVEVAAASGLNAQAVMRAYKNGGAISANTTIPTWTTVEKDSVGSFDASTGVYTVKSPGDYHVDFGVETPTVGSSIIVLNGTNKQYGSTATGNARSVVSTILADLKYGDTITTEHSGGGTLSANNDRTVLSIHKIGSEQQPYAPRVAYLKDVKANTVGGGTFTQDAWQTRDLNTFSGDQSFVSVSANQFTLQPGTYHINAKAPAFTVSRNKIKLRNITDVTDDIIGISTYTSASAGYAQTNADLEGTITISVATTFEIQHYCENTTATSGFGVSSNFGVDEVYTQVKITKVL